jgi:hypothetical protein
MSAGIVREAADGMADRNALLAVTLGLLSAAARFDALLERYAPVGAAADGPADDFTLFVLGLVALRQKLGGLLERVESPSPAPPLVEVGLAMRELLR